MATLKLNGESRSIEGPDDTNLLWAIRDMAGLTGTKYGCGIGLCGACTIHVDGVAVRSCQTTLGEVAGKDITTIEGLSSDGDHPVQVAWRDQHVPQCGFCQAGPDYAGGQSAVPEPRSERPGNPRRNVRQCLSLRLLRAHRLGRTPGCNGSLNHAALHGTSPGS